MRRLWLFALLSSAIFWSGCAALRPGASSAVPRAAWAQRAAVLQQAGEWSMDGRVAVAFGTQGWQATLDWRQHGKDSEVHLAGPLGIGAKVLRLSPAGLSIGGDPPGAAGLQQLQERLGFDLPLAKLRYWLLGVPDPAAAFRRSCAILRIAPAHLTQAGWYVDYDRYAAVGDDRLPAHMVLRRGRGAGAHRRRSLGAGPHERHSAAHWPAPGKAQFIPAHSRPAYRRVSRTADLFSVRRFVRRIALRTCAPTASFGATTVPAGVAEEEDLCVRAARALQRAAGCRLGADIDVLKRIPMGAGLGGGSSDAATYPGRAE